MKKMIAKESCSKCHVNIAVTHMVRHQNGANCKLTILSNNRAAELKDMVRFDQHTEIGQLVNFGVIPGAKMVADQFRAFVPKWVAEAYNMHRKNKYAGLTLHEFIIKMGEDSGSI